MTSLIIDPAAVVLADQINDALGHTPRHLGAPKLTAEPTTRGRVKVDLGNAHLAVISDMGLLWTVASYDTAGDETGLARFDHAQPTRALMVAAALNTLALVANY